MKLKSENNIIKLQNGNRLALFQKAVNAVQNRDAQTLQEANDEATLIEQEDRRKAYNQLHQLPQDTRFVPSNGGTVTEHEGPLYNNKLEKALDDTAKGQLAVRMANTLKKGVGLGFAVAGGNWLINGLKAAPFLTSMELLGGATAGKLGQSVGKRIDNKLHTHNQIVDFEKVLPFISMIGGAKGARNWFENNTIRGAIESGFQNLKFIPAQVKYYGPTMGKSYAVRTNDNIIDLDTWGKPEYDRLAKKYGYKDWREMILSDKGDYNQEYKALIKDQIKRIQSNPQYAGKTIVVSNASLLNPNSGIEFANTPTIPDRKVMAQRNNARHPWESIEHGEQWWDSLQAKGTPLKTDNRFVSEIEGNKVIEFTPKQDFTSTYHLDPRVKLLSRPISEAERLGIPKGERSNPKSLEDPYYWGYEQWNKRYNDAIDSGNVEEAKRLRGLHFKVKAPNTKIIDENGNPLEVYHGTGNNSFMIMDSRKNQGRTVGAGTKLSNFFTDKRTAKAYSVDASGLGTTYNGQDRVIKS